jgi:hypothetical protein
MRKYPRRVSFTVTLAVSCVSSWLLWSGMPGMLAQWTDLGVAGKGTFTVTNLPISNFAGWTATANATPLAADFNADGKTDVAVTGAADFAGWAALSNVRHLIGDFNGDGKADIALTGHAGWTTLPVAFSQSQ